MEEINKKDVIRLLETIAIYLELKGENPFRIAAYRKAAQGLEKDERSIKEIDDFTKVTGIGKGTNDIITEYVQTGKSEMLAMLEKEVPAGLIPLLGLPGLGGKRLAVLHKELGIVDAETLKTACEAGDVEKIKGFGKKTAQNMLQALQEQNTRPERLPVAYMLQIADDIERYLQSIPEIQTYTLAGSLRRLRETVKDVDFIIVPKHREKVRAALVNMPHIKEVIANGDTKVSVTLKDQYHVNVDFRLVEEKELATTLHYFTGSKDHNVTMRSIAKQRGEKLSEYGVEVEETGEVLQFDSEEALFHHFGLHYIPPEMREDNGEIAAFTEKVPLLAHLAIKGDLHMHTTWSDGAESIEDMVLAAQSRGYEFMAITDHSKFLRIANGLTEERLRRQWEEIDRLNEKYPDMHILRGIEMDILPNGTLDFTDDFLKELDIVIAAIHSSFDQTEEQIMNRLFTAMENPYVDIIAHPTGRLIGRRDGYRVDMEGLIEKARETNTALELNANPMRFDLRTDHLMTAQDAGVPIAINTDAHKIGNLDFMAYGVRMGKKAWLSNESVINTWDIDRLLSFLNRNK
jgi:DNA polymerase (family 10)